MLWQIPLPAHTEQDLYFVGFTGGGTLDEFAEAIGLLFKSENCQRTNGKDRIAHPRKPVVPVA